jgi:penicillin-insensitive murein DD-endopeptidase
MAVSIIASVGENGKNNTTDVTAIQTLLNKYVDPKVVVNGICTGKSDDPTVIAIKSFQATYTNSPDGRVDAGGGALKKLNAEPLILLPQSGGNGFYSYGAGTDKRQWGTPKTIETLTAVALDFWWQYPATKVGFGDISFQFGGTMSPHSTHKDGKNVDVRPCRLNDEQLPVTYTDANYDFDKTKYLVESFLCQINVKGVLFNDKNIQAIDKANVRACAGHDNHLHIIMSE